VAQVRGTRTVILDTRKTTPLWRDLEREAVCSGGGVSHRSDLAEMILVKDNHVDACGGVTEALERIYRRPRPKVDVIVEARTLAEVREAMRFPVNVVLLDNMPRSRVAKAVEIIHGRTQVEVSGGLALRDLRPLARLGVDRISLGSLTHSAPALDFSLVVDTKSRPHPRHAET
jgi:nicotinate-nucleotide pyrophosphorylase (carboxylating)